MDNSVHRNISPVKLVAAAERKISTQQSVPARFTVFRKTDCKSRGKAKRRRVSAVALVKERRSAAE
jgi:hypothetical protein